MNAIQAYKKSKHTRIQQNNNTTTRGYHKKNNTIIQELKIRDESAIRQEHSNAVTQEYINTIREYKNTIQ